MTILAGILSRSKEYPLDQSSCESLAKLISRHPDDEVDTFNDDRCFLAKVDINAYGQKAFRVDASGSVSMLAGEPLLSLGVGDGYRTRTEDLELLHQDLDSENWDLLRRARGTFCAAHYQPKTGCLTLIADKLGVRSLYFFEGDKYVFFASALRILQDLAAIPKRLDVRAVTEMATLHSPLSTRTPYAGVSLLRAAEITRVLDGKTSRFQYWRWDQLRPSRLSELELLEAAYTSFVTAIKLRLRNDSRSFALLSGGLDSRCVVGALRALNVGVHSLNFSPAKTQDQFFASEFAGRADTQHEEIPLDSRMFDSLGLYQVVAESFRASAERLPKPPERPRLVWGGNGGSVGLGHVYLSPQLVNILRSGKRDEAIEFYLDNAKLAKWVIHPRLYRSLSACVRTGISEELEDIHCEDAGRAFHLYLMLNDQRRHLCDWFEHIDLHRLELHLPFYDSELLELIASSPVDLYLGHRFYTKWLNCFPPFVTAVPWQTYPGHEPCPVEFDNDDLGYQFGGTFSRDWESLHKRALLRHAGEMLNAREFPGPIINRGVLRVATWAYRMGLGDYSYMIDTSYLFYKYWAKCQGRYITP